MASKTRPTPEAKKALRDELLQRFNWLNEPSEESVQEILEAVEPLIREQPEAEPRYTLSELADLLTGDKATAAAWRALCHLLWPGTRVDMSTQAALNFAHDFRAEVQAAIASIKGEAQ